MFLRLVKYVIPTFIGLSFIYFQLNPLIINYLLIICLLSICSWTIGYFLYDHFENEQTDPNGKVILITGCDTGFGNRLAYRLDKLGFNVFAGVLFPDGNGAQQLKQQCSDRLKIMRMDVTKPDDVLKVIEEIEKTSLPLWALVNNAGVGISVPFDWGNDIDVYRKVFDVNIFGVIRCAKYCMPLLRKSNGRIINVASAAGRMPGQWMGHYCMTKHNVRVLSDIIRRETMHNIKVITIEPSFYRTEIVNFKEIARQRKIIYDQTPANIKELYGNDENILRCMNGMNKFVSKYTNNNIDQVIDTMVKCCTLKYPKLYYRCCSYAEIILIWAASHLPELLLDFIFFINNYLLYWKFNIKFEKHVYDI